MKHSISFAGFWARLFAFLIDTIMAFTITFTLMNMFNIIPSDTVAHGMHTSPQWSNYTTKLMLIFASVHWILNAIMESSALQATFGKMLFSIRVVDDEGGRINLGQATIRSFCKLLFQTGMAITFIIVLFTDKKKTIHDFIAKTMVVKS